jgi:hypothetical protein
LNTANLYPHPEILKDIYDLILWRSKEQKIRFIEVKCLNKDRLTAEQQRFAELAKKRGILTKVTINHKWFA